MNIEIRCPERWAEARDKARSLRTGTLDQCVMRVIEYAMAKPWQIEVAKREADEALKVYNKWFEFYLRHKDDDLRARACNARWSTWDKFTKLNNRYLDLANGGSYKAVISNDFAELSFYFYIERPDGSMDLNGGIIFSERSDTWQIHT